eukprot:GHVU01012962.1.p1 GENE.GHVU01012962.1~~GHVU01012962.1.p1  ORF type:complete len:108 (-),score=9.41 GHVU01012962.1:107-430(-)
MDGRTRFLIIVIVVEPFRKPIDGAAPKPNKASGLGQFVSWTDHNQNNQNKQTNQSINQSIRLSSDCSAVHSACSRTVRCTEEQHPTSWGNIDLFIVNKRVVPGSGAN